jgi:carbamate kinase
MKVEAANRFVKKDGKKAILTSIDNALQILSRNRGQIITRKSESR